MHQKICKLKLYLIFLLCFMCPGFAPAAGTSDTVHQSGPTSCTLAPLQMPSTPAKIPGYAELDPSTGLHVTGTMQQINVKNYRLEVSGKVDNPLRLTIDDLRCMTRIQARTTLVCPGVFEDVATWAGAPLKSVLLKAKVHENAVWIRLIGADDYSVLVPIKTALSDESLLAYEWEGKALPRLHGYPLRAVFPGSEGLQWVKWLIKIEVR